MISINKFAFFAVSLGAASLASASAIDFEGFGDDFSNPINVQGFQFDFAAGAAGVLNDSTDIGFSITHNGTTRAFMVGNESGGPAQVTFKPLDNSAFSMQKLDGATFFTGVQGGFDVIGTLKGGGTVSASFSTNDSFATYLLPGTFVNLDHVVIKDQISAGTLDDPGISFDNIVVNEQPVPEPATLSALGLALAAFAKRRKRK